LVEHPGSSLVRPGTLLGFRIFKSAGYRPNWWSVHYSNRVEMHCDDQVITIPTVLQRKLRFFERRFMTERLSTQTLGQIGYDAYCKFTDNKSLVSGAELPAFDKLPVRIQEAWEKAGQAVAASVGRAGEIVGQADEPSPEPETGSTTIVK
jgi:hypothetical protein